MLRLKRLRRQQAAEVSNIDSTKWVGAEVGDSRRWVGAEMVTAEAGDPHEWVGIEAGAAEVGDSHRCIGPEAGAAEADNSVGRSIRGRPNQIYGVTRLTGNNNR